jgi:hypothetical protein
MGERSAPIPPLLSAYYINALTIANNCIVYRVKLILNAFSQHSSFIGISQGHKEHLPQHLFLPSKLVFIGLCLVLNLSYVPMKNLLGETHFLKT